MITLHRAESTVFTSLGLGVISDMVGGVVIEELNGIFELSMKYPTTGIRYKDFQLRRIIYAKPNPYSDPQPFRIYSISKPINRIVTINACHISYDLTGYPVNEFKGTSPTDTMSKLKSNAQIPHNFTFNSTVISTGEVNVDGPRSTRSVLGNNILSAYGGEYEFDNFMVYHYASRGMNRGVSVRYGKNMTDLNQEENISNVYTGVYPYWEGTDLNTNNKILFKLPERVINTPGTYSFTRILPLDLSQEFTEKPTEEKLREKANKYITDNKIGIPTVALTMTFIQLSKSTENSSFKVLDQVELGDTISVYFEELGVDAAARCIKTTYNLCTDRYDSIDLGDAKSNLSVGISDSKKETAKAIEKQKVFFDAEVGNIKIDIAHIDEAIIDKADINWVTANYAHLVNGYIDIAQIKDASIGTAQIKDAEITIAKIQNAFVDSLVAAQGKFQSAHIGVLTSDNLSANTITADYIKSVVIQAINLNVSGKINADRINTSGLVVENIDAGSITTGSLSSDVIKGNVITAINLSTETATIDSAKIGSLSADKITTGSLSSDVIKTNVISAINASIGIIDASRIDTDNLVVKNIDAGSITTGDLDAMRIQATVIAAINSYAGTAKIKQAQIETLKVGSANITDLDVSKLTGGIIDAKFIDADKLQVNAANINGTLTADKIKGGILDANEMTVVNLNAQSITVGKINGQQIGAGAISKTNLDTILAGEITDIGNNVTTLLEESGLIRQDIEVINENAAKKLVSYFAQNQNATTAPTSGWSTTVPTWKNGYYTWEKIETEYLDGTKVMGSPVNITGATGATGAQGPKGDQGIQGLQGPKGDQGMQGPKGVDGLSSYTHIAYATGTTGQNFNVNHFASATYIGMYVDNTAADSTDYTKYAWNLIKGADGSQGIQGPKGDNGQTPYFHTAWANNITGTSGFSTTDSVGKTHIGVYTDYTSADSTDPTKYSWTLIKGDTGAQGPTGATGNGVSNIVKEFYLSTSKTSQSGGSWSTTQPPWVLNKYLWTRDKITYTNSTTPVYTTPQVSSEWEAINSIEVGGRNYIKDSDFIVQVTKDAYAPNRTISLVDSITWTEKELTERFINKTLTFSYLVYNPGEMTYSTSNPQDSMKNRFGIHGAILWKDSTGALADKSEYPFDSYLQIQFDVKQRVYQSYTVTPPAGYDTISKMLFAYQPLAKPGPNNNEIWIIGQPKLEISNTGTDYSPAPEDTDTKIASITAIADGKNTIYYSASAPAVAGKKENDTWFDTDDGNRIYRLTGGVWTAAQFGQNAIAANAIVANHITAGSVVAGKLATNAVVADNIAANAIVAGKIATNAVTAGTIAANAIVAGKIAANAVTATTIATDAITSDKIMAKAITAEKVDVDSLYANEAFLKKLSAVSIDATQITTNKIQGDQIELSGIISYSALDTTLQPIFNVTGNKTYINGGMIAANSIKANSIDLLSGMTVHGPDNNVSFSIADNGLVTVNALLRSGNFDELKKTGYQLNTNGSAILNQALVRGKVELPNAGMTNDYDIEQKEGRNLILNSDTLYDNTKYLVAVYTMSENWVKGQKYTIILRGELQNEETQSFGAWLNSGSHMAGLFTKRADGLYYLTFTAVDTTSGNERKLSIYAYPNTAGTRNKIYYIKVEKGENPDISWTAAPEDNSNPVRIWAGKSYDLRDSAPFRVMQNGTFYATDAILSGILYGRVDSGFVNIDQKQFSIVDDTTVPNKEYVRMNDVISMFDVDFLIGNSTDKMLDVSRVGRTITTVDVDTTLTGRQTSMVFNSNIGDLGGLNLVGVISEGRHVLRHSNEETRNGTLVFDSQGSRANEADFSFTRKNYTEDTTVFIDGYLKIKKDIKSTTHNIEMRSVPNEGWGFYAG